MLVSDLLTEWSHRNLDAVELFIDLGADVNLKCHGTPSLHLAIMISSLPEGLAFGCAAASIILNSSCDLSAKVIRISYLKIVLTMHSG